MCSNYNKYIYQKIYSKCMGFGDIIYTNGIKPKDSCLQKKTSGKSFLRNTFEKKLQLNIEGIL